MTATAQASPRRAPKRTGAAVRTHILETATQLFAAQGFDAVTTRDICTAAQVSTSVVYRHFADKQALYVECTVDAYKSVVAQAFAPLDEGVDVHTLLFAIARNLCEIYLANSDVPKLLLRQMLERNYDMLRELAEEVTLDFAKTLVARTRELGVSEAAATGIVYSLYAMTFGFAQMTPQIALFSFDLPDLERADGMAIHVLSLIHPPYDWTVFGRR